MKRIGLANLAGLLLGSLLFLIPVSDSGEKWEWAGPEIILVVFVLLVSVYLQYLAISGQRSGCLRFRADTFRRDRHPKSFAFAQVTCCLGSSLLFVLLVWMVYCHFVVG